MIVWSSFFLIKARSMQLSPTQMHTTQSIVKLCLRTRFCFIFFAGKYLMRMHAPGFNATVDFPASAYYEELLRTFPKAKVVLSVRENGEKWARSFITLMAFHVSILRTWIRAHVHSIRVALMCLPPRKPRSVRKSHTHCSGPLRCAPHCSVNI